MDNSGFPGDSMVKIPPGMRVQSLGWEDPLEKEMSTHSSILAWEIPRTEEAVRHSPWVCVLVRCALVTKQQHHDQF